MIKNGKVFGKVNIIDFAVLIAVVMLILGIFVNKIGFFKPIAKVSKGTMPIEFTITTRAYDITSERELFNVGEKTFITIRNVPYTELEVIDVKKEPIKEMFFNYDRPEVPYLINNVAYPHRAQYIITVKDTAQITNDGAVVGGNKIKIGLPVDLEGFNYRLGGSVSDVKIIEEQDSEKE